MIKIDDALQILADATGPLETEEVALEQAAGRVLAESVAADRDFPPTDRSAMDGFAVRASDLTAEPRVLRVAGEIPAGTPVGETRVAPGEAVRLFTGSIVPPGADAVMMVEYAAEDVAAGTVTFSRTARAGQHIRGRGNDVTAGDTVLETGAPIHPPECAALASVGRTGVRVYRRPVVSVLATGDELVDAASTPQDHQIRNSNSITLLGQLREMGLEGRGLGVAPDNPVGLDAAIRTGLDGDLLLITGGVSVGKYDLVGEALERAGLRLLFYKVAVKPGKPILAGRCGSCLVIGLPGNPVSAYAGFAVFVAPVLRRMMGYRRWPNRPVRARLAETLRQATGRPTYHLARLDFDDRGYVARAVGSTGSGDLFSMARANGFVITPADESEIPAGTELPALLWREYQLR